MPTRTKDRPERPIQFVLYAGLVVTALWLLAFLMPGARTLMLDRALSFVLSLMATGLLWWAAVRGLPARRFWCFLAAGWSLDLMGDLLWGASELVSGKSLPPLSAVDALYVGRYVLVLVALWGYRHPVTARQWLRFLAVLGLVALGLVAGFVVAVPPSRQTAFWLGLAFYPFLDAGLVYLAVGAWRDERPGAQRNALGLLSLALLAYGVANWLNVTGQAIPAAGLAGLADLFWPLSDILAGVAVLHVLWTDSVRSQGQGLSQGEG